MFFMKIIESFCSKPKAISFQIIWKFCTVDFKRSISHHYKHKLISLSIYSNSFFLYIHYIVFDKPIIVHYSQYFIVVSKCRVAILFLLIIGKLD